MPRFSRLVGRHQHHRGGAVVQARGVAGGDGAVLGESGPQLLHRLDGSAEADVLVGVDDDVALAGLDGEGGDLVLEPTGLLGGLGLVLGSQRELVLLLAGELPLGGDVLGGRAHVVAVEGVPEAVLDHGVDELHVAHLLTRAQVGGVGRERHALLAAGDDDGVVAERDMLRAERDGA